jgi:outer membrane protein assembly factor BamB
MRVYLSPVLAILLAVSTVAAQPISRTYTRPAIPSSEVLDRLNLKLAWRVFVPTDGFRDGLASVQILEDQVLVQTRSGGVVLLDAATGATAWRARVGVPYRGTQPLGYNSQSVFVTNADRLYALSRRTGTVQWSMALPSAPTSAPVADDTEVYLCLGTGRVYAYQLPNLTAATRLAEKPAGDTAAENAFRPPPGTLSTVGTLSKSYNYRPDREPSGPRPGLIWDQRVGSGRLEQAPLLTDEFLTLVGSDGLFYTTSKFQNQLLYSFQAEAPVSAPLAQYGETAYVASRDYNTYALSIATGRILWRFLGGAPILRKPEVFDEEVYVAPERVGLYRIDRVFGQVLWHNRQADRFVAQNRKFVYAADFSGRLVILDRARGTLLTTYDGTRDFVFPVANEQSDRIFLASNDGLVVCLYDRDYPAPLRMKSPEKAAPKPKEEAKPAEKPKEKDETEPPEKPEKEKPEKPAKPVKPAKPEAKGDGKDT